MNLCTCCYDEAAGIWCGCPDPHEQDSNIIDEARDYMSAPRDMEVAEQQTFYCTACDRYTAGTAYYTAY